MNSSIFFGRTQEVGTWGTNTPGTPYGYHLPQVEHPRQELGPLRLVNLKCTVCGVHLNSAERSPRICGSIVFFLREPFWVVLKATPKDKHDFGRSAEDRTVCGMFGSQRDPLTEKRLSLLRCAAAGLAGLLSGGSRSDWPGAFV